MPASDDSIKAIDTRVMLASTPSAVYRALTSQTELRKWWAPRVIMSRNIVSFDDGRDMEMRLLNADKNHSVRYSWKSASGDGNENTVITFQIEDLGVSRGKTGEGISLEVTHDGWTDGGARERQEKIWKAALPCLKAHLEGKKFTPWWQSTKGSGGFRPVKVPAIRQQIDKLDRESRTKGGKKHPGTTLWKICQGLDAKGAWYMKETGDFELRVGANRIFAVNKSAQIVLNWTELAQILGERMPEIASRLAVEQDITPDISGTDKIAAISIDAALWVKWCADLLTEAGVRK